MSSERINTCDRCGAKETAYKSGDWRTLITAYIGQALATATHDVCGKCSEDFDKFLRRT